MRWENDLTHMVTCPVKQRTLEDLEAELNQLLEAPAPTRKWEFDRRVALIRKLSDRIINMKVAKALLTSKKYQELIRQHDAITQEIDSLYTKKREVEQQMRRIKEEYSSIYCGEVNDKVEAKINEWLLNLGGVKR